LSTSLRQFQAKSAEYQEVVFDIEETERPPMVEIAEYLARFPRSGRVS